MGPKVRGAWHLHELFPNLDFFVSLSSIVGVIGRMGASIYAGTSVCPLNPFLSLQRLIRIGDISGRILGVSITARNARCHY